MIPEVLLPVSFFIGCGAGGLFGWQRAQKAGGGRLLRQMYAERRSPVFIRLAIPLAPLWASASLGFALLVLLPRPVAQWLVLLVLLPIEAAFVLAYRCPPSLLPRWLRDEIEAGITPRAKPDWGDWLLFLVVVPLMVLGDMALPILILFYSRPAG